MTGSGLDVWPRSKKSRAQEFDKTEKFRGRDTNILAGLRLHRDVMSPREEQLLLQQVEEWVAAGRRGDLVGTTFSAPKKWMRGKGRVTVQFGCSYSYMKHSIMSDEAVELLPPILEDLVDRLVASGVLPAARRPDSAIVNVYSEGDCIPPHIDHHDFVRPFCTISMLSKQPMVSPGPTFKTTICLGCLPTSLLLVGRVCFCCRRVRPARDRRPCRVVSVLSLYSPVHTHGLSLSLSRSLALSHPPPL